MKEADNLLAADVKERDPTLNKVFDPNYGEAADRKAVGEKRTRSKVEEDEDDEG